MNKRVVVVLTMLAALAAAWVTVRYFVSSRAEGVLIRPAPPGAPLAADSVASFSEFFIESGTRRLQARLVRSADTATPGTAVLVFHGNRTTVSDMVDLQLVLFRAGITSMVFDYTGFGNSTGTPSVRRLRQDARAAFGAFVDSVGRTTRKFVMGTSLGAAVIMDSVHDLQLGVEGVILIGTFASSRETAVRQGRVPGWAAFVLEDHYNNVEAAGQLRKPLLVIHSEQDELFPMSDAEAIVATAAGVARLVRLVNVAHDRYLTAEQHWKPIIQFMKAPGEMEVPSEADG